MELLSKLIMTNPIAPDEIPAIATTAIFFGVELSLNKETLTSVSVPIFISSNA